MARLHCPQSLASGQAFSLPAGAARHVQVLRLQPGAQVTLFSGDGSGEYQATIEHMGRSEVRVQVGARIDVAREVQRKVHLLVGIAANERMDWLVEKATELGAASIAPLLTQRAVVRLSGERAEKKRLHWQAVATAACEQCGRNLVPPVRAVQDLSACLQSPVNPSAVRLLLSLREDAKPLTSLAKCVDDIYLLSGPEGGLSPAEEAAAIAVGFIPVSLGQRTLRAETAPIAALVALTMT